MNKKNVRPMTLMFSIIIPVKAINDYVRETVSRILALDLPVWELTILPNEEETNEWTDDRIRIVASGRVGPAKKRDMGAELANGDVLVFLDDDSYPAPNLLSVAKLHFEDRQVVAIGGPAVTPPDDSFWQKVSGAFFLSRLSGGTPERYVPVGKVREVDDWPSVNLMVCRTDFLAVGGFNSPFWPGEDTKLCMDLVMKTSKKILYVPELVVWHHRRAGFFGHMKQVGSYGLHRGFFAKRFPETSRRPVYFIPMLFLFFTIFSLGYVWFPVPLQQMILLGWSCYGVALLISLRTIVGYESLTVGLAALVYTFFSHLSYGFMFLRGLLTIELVSRLR